MTKTHNLRRHAPAALLAAALAASAVGAQAAPITIKYSFDSAGSYANPGLDSTLSIPPELLNFTPWSDADGTLLQSSPIQPSDGLNGQGGSGRAVGARGWDGATTGNSFLFSFDVAPGSLFSISQISFWQQGSSGNQGLGPTTWTMSIKGQQVANGSATRGNPGGTVTVASGLPGNLAGTVSFAVAAFDAAPGTGTSPAPASQATWRIDNFTITGDLTPVPAPAAAWLLGSAVIGLAGLRRRRA